MRLILVILFLCICNVYSQVDVIKEFLDNKFLTLGYIFTCITNPDKITLVNQLSKLPLRFSILNINKIVTSNMLVQIKNIAIIVNGSCSNTATFLKQFNTYCDFNENKHWFVFSKDKGIINNFQEINININVDLTIAIMRNDRFWEIFELYNTGYFHGGKLIMNLIGVYSKHHGYVTRETRNKYWRRKNLGNIHVKLATMLSYPHKGQLEDYMISDNIDKGVDTMNRVGYTIVTECLDFYNISWRTILTHSWGYPDKNNTFDGIIGEVQRRRADMGTGLYARPDRIPYVDYGTSMYILAHDIMFLRQGYATPYLIYIRPFNVKVWYVLVALVISVQIMIRLIQSVEIKTIRSNIENTWSESLICILGHLCQQGASNVPHLFSGRIIIFTLSQFALLLFQLYSASVVSSLLIKPPPDIRNLQDLVHSKLGFGSEDLKYVRDLFNTTNLPVLQELKQNKLKETNYMPPKEGLALVNKGGFSYFTELNTGYPIIENTFSNSHVCDLQTLKLIRDARVYTNFQKNSPFRKMMNVCIRRLDETSITNRLRSQWMSRKPTCFKEQYLAASVGLNEFLPLATLLFLGYLNSYIILIIEIFWKRFSNPKNKNIKSFKHQNLLKH